MRVPRLSASAAMAMIDLLFPPRCVGCRREGAYLCAECERGLPRDAVGVLGMAGGPLDGVLTPFRMEGAARDAVHRLKYRGLRALAPTMGRLLAERVSGDLASADVVVPVPLHRRRLRQRGYNQAGLIAHELGRRVGLPVEGGGLVRVRGGASQAGSDSREERRANVDGAFKAARDFHGLSVVLVDDVTTTGATFEACATALKAADARRVVGVAFAREL